MMLLSIVARDKFRLEQKESQYVHNGQLEMMEIVVRFCLQVIEFYFNDISIVGNDRVFIYDGPNSSAPLIGALSADVLNGYPYVNINYGKFASTQSSMFISFQTDEYTVSRGFNATYVPLNCKSSLLRK